MLNLRHPKWVHGDSTKTQFSASENSLGLSFFLMLLWSKNLLFTVSAWLGKLFSFYFVLLTQSAHFRFPLKVRTLTFAFILMNFYLNFFLHENEHEKNRYKHLNMQKAFVFHHPLISFYTAQLKLIVFLFKCIVIQEKPKSHADRRAHRNRNGTKP